MADYFISILVQHCRGKPDVSSVNRSVNENAWQLLTCQAQLKCRYIRM